MTLDELLSAELELRDHLLCDAAEDDRYASRHREEFLGHGPGSSIEYKHSSLWPVFRALDELRLVERRIFQIKEAMRGR